MAPKDWKAEYKRFLREAASDAKKAEQEWERRWFVSLAVGNAAGLAAMASAVLQVTLSREKSGILVVRYALLPAGWFFAIGLVFGALLPYCWQKMVEKVGDWASLQEEELDANAPVPVYGSDDDYEPSNAVIAKYEKHHRRWHTILTYFERSAAGCFLLGLVWLLVWFTGWAFWITK